MQARGNTKLILKKVGEIQNLIGAAQRDYNNDGGRNRVDRAGLVKTHLDKAFEICMEIRDMYNPI
jgi:hypothetical protein